MTSRPGGVPLDCRAFIELLSDALDGTLREGVASSFGAHRRTCPACARYLASYARTVELQAWAFERTEAPPSELIHAILERRAFGSCH